MKFSKSTHKKAHAKKAYAKKVRTRDIYVVGSTPIPGQQLAIFTTNDKRWDIVIDSPSVEVRGSIGSEHTLDSHLEFMVSGYDDRQNFVRALIVTDSRNADELIVRSLTVEAPATA